MKRVMHYGDPGVPRPWINATGSFSPSNLASSAWRRRALCAGRDPHPWFARWDSALVDGARELCQQCPVRGQCLGTALLCGDEHGIWGGLDPRQRLALDGRLAAGEPLGKVVVAALARSTGSRRGAA